MLILSLSRAFSIGDWYKTPKRTRGPVCALIETVTPARKTRTKNANFDARQSLGERRFLEILRALVSCSIGTWIMHEGVSAARTRVHPKKPIEAERERREPQRL